MQILFILCGKLFDKFFACCVPGCFNSVRGCKSSSNGIDYWNQSFFVIKEVIRCIFDSKTTKRSNQSVQILG